MPYVLVHDTDGVFVGHCLGLAFFSAQETAGQIQAPTVASAKEVEAMWRDMGFSGEKMRAVEVASGNWRDLRAAGLDVGDMPENELRYAPAAGAA